MKQLNYSKQALKFLNKLDYKNKQRIILAIEHIPIGNIKKLKGYNGLFRLRVGDYRVIYSEDFKILNIIYIGNRGDIYKNI